MLCQVLFYSCAVKNDLDCLDINFESQSSVSCCEWILCRIQWEKVQILPEQLCFDFSHFLQSSCKIAAFLFGWFWVCCSKIICLAVHLRMLFCTVIGIPSVVIYISQSIRERKPNTGQLSQGLFALFFHLVGGYKVGRKHHVYKN